MKILTYVEIDVDYCSLTYGVAPCTAAIGVTGEAKCFNTLKTCQDLENFNNQPVTLRFTMPSDYLPSDIEAIPNLSNVAVNPSTISLGTDLGMRATLTVNFEDHRHSDTGPGFDKYHAERPYDPYRQGTMWGKFRARQPYLLGRPIRLIQGYLGQNIEDMETRHFVIESFEGPGTDGTYQIVAKDVLKLADNDRAQAPRLSEGRLLTSISETALGATLTPTGIGNAKYPTSGYIAIGGEEICSFTRTGDALTLVRGQLGTTAATHDADDRVQIVLRYEGESPADIIADLLQNYADVDPSFIPLSDWQEEVTTYLGRLYTATIAEPTGVNKLISELIEQAALAVWWDEVTQIIRLRVLRGVGTDAAKFTEEDILEGSLKVKEQPNKRLSQVWTYYGQRNPFDGDDSDNFRSALATVEVTEQGNYGAPAIKKIHSRWIAAFGSSTAERLNEILLGRFKIPPRRFEFEVLRRMNNEFLKLGEGYNLEAWSLQDETGKRVVVPLQVTRLEPKADRFRVEAEEMLFTALDPGDRINRVIIIDSNYFNFDLEQVHNSIYPVITPQDVIDGVNLTVIISNSVKVGSTSTQSPAFTVGNFAAGLPITLDVRGRIQGAGGRGGSSGSGGAGGTALYTRQNITLIDENGQIWGGAGGGGATVYESGIISGGSGAGYLPGETVSSFSTAATTEKGGTNDYSGDGGDPGQPGGAQPGTIGFYGGGAAGKAIDGKSYITQSGPTGDRRGPQIA